VERILPKKHLDQNQKTGPNLYNFSIYVNQIQNNKGYLLAVL